jgi:hypothetical protein
MENINECYGKYSAADKNCLKCRYENYCQDAKDPAQLSYENFDKAIATPTEGNTFECFDDSGDEKTYTSSQMCLMLHTVFALDDSIFRILKLKILSPSMTDEQIGDAFNITKQAVSKLFKRFSTINPQLRRMLSPAAKIITGDAERHLNEANRNLVECLKIINGEASMTPTEKYNSRMRQRSLEAHAIEQRHRIKRENKRLKRLTRKGNNNA